MKQTALGSKITVPGVDYKSQECVWVCTYICASDMSLFSKSLWKLFVYAKLSKFKKKVELNQLTKKAEK